METKVAELFTYGDTESHVPEKPGLYWDVMGYSTLESILIRHTDGTITDAEGDVRNPGHGKYLRLGVR